MKGAASITEFPFPFPSFLLLPFQRFFGSKLHFCGLRRECGLQREDQQDDDEDRTGEESDGGPLAAV